jgi:hypothetical protein
LEIFRKATLHEIGDVQEAVKARSVQAEPDRNATETARPSSSISKKSRRWPTKFFNPKTEHLRVLTNRVR